MTQCIDMGSSDVYSLILWLLGVRSTTFDFVVFGSSETICGCKSNRLTSDTIDGYF